MSLLHSATPRKLLVGGRFSTNGSLGSGSKDVPGGSSQTPWKGVYFNVCMCVWYCMSHVTALRTHRHHCVQKPRKKGKGRSQEKGKGEECSSTRKDRPDPRCRPVAGQCARGKAWSGSWIGSRFTGPTGELGPHSLEEWKWEGFSSSAATQLTKNSPSPEP